MTFIRKERLHLQVLHERLERLRVDDPARSNNPEYAPGEANALAWALGVVEGSVEPVEVRIERVEHRLRQVASKLANIERELEEE